ncbi:hypothetical protein [Fictibacillus sp. NRS-1165]|uniref:hypothetical protein n=1 Tax=Fictibacillus sp. NRS-1165 TaxID=3144463 RepID=UPI003D20FE8B
MFNSEFLQQAEAARHLYQINKISRKEAAEKIMPYINEFNERSKSIAKKYGRRPQVISFAKFCR